jgi:hypothetical protein
MRAQRRVIELPIRYKRAGLSKWLQGTTVNISHSGVLFRGSQLLAIDTPIDIAIVLSASQALVSQMGCAGRIVRIAGQDVSGPAMAAAFSSAQRFTQLDPRSLSDDARSG